MLFLKLFLVPFLVGFVSYLSKRVDIRIAGSIAALPIISGPTFLILALENDKEFAIQAANKTLLGVFAIGVFITIFCIASIKSSWWFALLKGWVAFGLTAFILSQVGFPLLINLMISLLAPVLLVRVCPSPEKSLPIKKIPNREIFFRMIAAETIVLLVSTFAPFLGPNVSGVLTAFPVAASVLGAFTLKLHGYELTQQLLHGLLRSTYCITSFFFASALLLPYFSIWSTLLVSIVVTFSFQWILVSIHLKKIKTIELKLA